MFEVNKLLGWNSEAHLAWSLFAQVEPQFEASGEIEVL